MVGSDALLPPSHAALSCREVIPGPEGGEPTSFILHHSPCVLVVVVVVGVVYMCTLSLPLNSLAGQVKRSICFVVWRELQSGM